MSHLHERKEKNCLNCGTEVHGRFCQNCGQENVEIKESFWHLTTHFVADIFHYDSKFFSTLKYLLFRPGFLTKEYLAGRRASYLHPIKMYVFISAVFFLIFFALVKITDKEHVVTVTEIDGIKTKDIEKYDDSAFAKYTAKINKENKKDSVPMTRQEFKKYIDSLAPKSPVRFPGEKFNSLNEYDSLVKAGKIEKSWFTRFRVKKETELNRKFNGDGKKALENIIEKFFHLVPQMLFVSLPAFALILYLLYSRRKQYYYVSHIVFSLHLYCAIFLLALLSLIISSTIEVLKFNSQTVDIAFGVIILLYVYIALLNFYKQGYGKTILKYFILYLVQGFVMIFLFLLFLAISAITI